MELGTGIAVGTVVIAVFGIIMKVLPSKDNMARCVEHGAVASELSNLREWLQRIEAKLDKVFERL